MKSINVGDVFAPILIFLTLLLGDCDAKFMTRRALQLIVQNAKLQT